VCGDLYPTDDERRIILSSIQAYCGPPRPQKLKLPKGEIAYFDNWKCGDRIKHKGCAVGDLERARRDPSSWGVSGVANHSGERPARPNRFIQSSLVPTLQSKVQKQDEPSQAIVPDGPVVAGDGEPLGSREPLGDKEPPVDKGPEDKEPPAGEENRRELDTEDDEQTSVLLMISEQQTKLKAAQDKAAAIKEAKKAKQPASKGQRADKKTEHTVKVGVIDTHPIATHPIATHPIATHPKSYPPEELPTR
jgi:hypothetical protein